MHELSAIDLKEWEFALVPVVDHGFELFEVPG
jgi:hypothetical protein